MYPHEIYESVRQLPPRERLKLVEQILSDLAQHLPAERNTKATYDFSDLSGQLAWQGDAVAEQRKLRDEC
ncbi:MAG: hypothetical protein M1546_03585 [Chloroflexi bacterium]|nr:hypothetical protein [Chloroflexota bacterium]